MKREGRRVSFTDELIIGSAAVPYPCEDAELVEGELLLGREDVVAEADEGTLVAPEEVLHRDALERLLVQDVQHRPERQAHETPRVLDPPADRGLRGRRRWLHFSKSGNAVTKNSELPTLCQEYLIMLGQTVVIWNTQLQLH